jgi:hypothetical protein
MKTGGMDLNWRIVITFSLMTMSSELIFSPLQGQGRGTYDVMYSEIV